MSSIHLFALIAIIPMAMVSMAPVDVTNAVDADTVTAFTTEGTSGNIVDVSGKGDYLWCIDSANKIYQFDSNSNKWVARSNDGLGTRIPKKVGASPEGGAWLSTADTSGAINNALRWPKGGAAWILMGGIEFPVSPVSDAVAVVLTTVYNGRMRDFTGVNYAPDSSPAASGIWVSVGDQKERWYINDQKQFYRLNQTANAYQKLPGDVLGCSLDVQCAKRAVMTSTCGDAFIWNNAKQQWNQLPFSNVKFATVNYKAVYVVTKDGKLLQYIPPREYDCPCLTCPAW